MPWPGKGTDLEVKHGSISRPKTASWFEDKLQELAIGTSSKLYITRMLNDTCYSCLLLPTTFRHTKRDCLFRQISHTRSFHYQRAIKFKRQLWITHVSNADINNWAAIDEERGLYQFNLLKYSQGERDGGKCFA